MKISLLLLQVGLVVFCYISAAHANTWSLFGYDAYSAGVGQARTGGVDGPAAVFYNPAGLVKQKNTSVTAAYIRGRPLLDFRPNDNPDQLDFAGYSQIPDTKIQESCGTIDESDPCVSDYFRYNRYVQAAHRVSGVYARTNQQLAHDATRPKQVNGITLGMANPITDVFGRFPVAFGVSVYLPLDPAPTLLDQEIMGPTTPHFIRFANDPHRVLVNMGIALEPVDRFRLGLAVDVNAKVSAAAQASALLPAEMRLGSIFDLNPNVYDIAIVPSGRAKAELALTPTVGLQFSPSEQWDIGLSYHEKQSTTIAVDATIIIEAPTGQARIPVLIDSNIRFQPRTVAAGVAWRPTPKLQLATDVSFQQWSLYYPDFAIGGRVQASDISDATCRVLESISNLEDVIAPITELLGLDASNVCGLLGDQIDNDIEFETWSRDQYKLKNIFVPAFGIDYSFDRFQVSSGYRYERNPVPVQDGIFNLLSAHTHIVGASLGIDITEKVSLRSFGQYHLLQRTTTTKNLATIQSESNYQDPFPDLDDDLANAEADGFTTDQDVFDQLTTYVDGTQNLNPGSNGYTVGGGYLTGGLQLSILF